MMRASGRAWAMRCAALADQLPGLRGREQACVLLERHRAPSGESHRTLGCQLRLGVVLREEPRLLAGAAVVLGHVNLGMTPEHLIQRRGATLGVADDEEIGQPVHAGRRRGGVLKRGCHNPRA